MDELNELTKEELGTKLGDANSYCQNIKFILENSFGGIDDVLFNKIYEDLVPLCETVNDLYTRYVKYDTEK